MTTKVFVWPTKLKIFSLTFCRKSRLFYCSNLNESIVWSVCVKQAVVGFGPMEVRKPSTAYFINPSKGSEIMAWMREVKAVRNDQIKSKFLKVVPIRTADQNTWTILHFQFQKECLPIIFKSVGILKNKKFAPPQPPLFRGMHY